MPLRRPVSPDPGAGRDREGSGPGEAGLAWPRDQSVIRDENGDLVPGSRRARPLFLNCPHLYFIPGWMSVHSLGTGNSW